MILRKSRLFSIVVCIITVLSVLSLMVPKGTYAEENDKSITLVCINGDTILAGMEWKIYRVGQRASNGQNFVQTGDFSGIQINLRRMNEDSINKAAQAFQAFAVALGIQPVQKGTTNEYGELQFTGLSSGLYLISGKLLKIDSNYYVPTTALVEIKEDDNDLRYDAYPKFEYKVMAGHPIAHIVFKEWEGDEEHPDKRPDHVVVDIYRDEEYYKTVILNEENNWRHRWVDDDGSSGWIVMERDIPECYEMFIEYDTNYRIKNSYTDEPFTTTTQSVTGTVSTTTTTVSTSISVGQVSTTAGTTTTESVKNSTVSRTRTTTGTGIGTGTGNTTTTNTVGNGTVSRTRTTAGTSTGTGTGNTTTTTNTVGNGTVSRTRTTTGTGTGVQTSTTTTRTVEGGAATKTNNTSTRQDNATATTTKSSGGTETTTKTTGGNSGGNVTTTKKPGNGNGSGGGSSGGKGSGGSVKLPQTGQLWWPVVPLSISGVLCVSAGLVIRTRKKSDD